MDRINALLNLTFEHLDIRQLIVDVFCYSLVIEFVGVIIPIIPKCFHPIGSRRVSSDRQSFTNCNVSNKRHVAYMNYDVTLQSGRE